MSAKEKYFTIYFIHLIYKACQLYLPVPISVTVSIFTVSVFTLLTLTPNMPTLFTAIPQHIIISLIHCIGSILLNTLHSHFRWHALPCCYEPNWPNTTFIFLGLSTDLNPRRFKIFSTDGIKVVKNLNTRVLDFISSLRSFQSEYMALFMDFNFWIDPVYFWVL